ncbi:MAG: hypothetical protein JSS39_11215 [Nitrospira sp.]|nr:hypothetical protein [Nitrospira sp.]
MKAKELLDANQLSAAILELNQEAKQRPTDLHIRTFLFELLCFDGAYERAERQLDVIGLHNERAGIGVEVYRQLLKADKARRRWFAEGLKPTFLIEPPAWIQHQLEAGHRLRGRQVEEATALFQEAADRRPKLTGLVNGTRCAEFRDIDDRLGAVLEVFFREQYVWLPIEQVRKMTLPPPKQLRDLLWIPATIETEEGASGQLYLPALYVGSQSEGNDQLRLGRMTDWRELGDGLVGGVGQKMFLADDRELSILEIREMEFQVE